MSSLGISRLIGVPSVRPSKTPLMMRTVSLSLRWVTSALWPGARRSSSGWISDSESASRGGQPSTTAPIAAPCDSPQVVTRKSCPKVLPMSRPSPGRRAAGHRARPVNRSTGGGPRQQPRRTRSEERRTKDDRCAPRSSPHAPAATLSPGRCIMPRDAPAAAAARRTGQEEGRVTQPSIADDFSRYLRPHELEAELRRLAGAYPALATPESIGRSHQGRDLWVLTLTNQATGPALDKPAVYLDGCHHAGEVTGAMVCLYTIWR